jgi:hypothetical protein
MYKYTIKGNEKIIILQEGNVIYSIPENPDNTDYKKYLEWVAEGNEAEEWVAE